MHPSTRHSESISWRREPPGWNQCVTKVCALIAPRTPCRTPAYLGTLHGFTRRFCYGVSIIRIVSHDHHNISPISVHPISAIVCHCPIRTHRMGDARRTDRFRRQRNLTNRIVLRPHSRAGTQGWGARRARVKRLHLDRCTSCRGLEVAWLGG